VTVGRAKEIAVEVLAIPLLLMRLAWAKLTGGDTSGWFS
jgi:hypothetical protein